MIHSLTSFLFSTPSHPLTIETGPILLAHYVCVTALQSAWQLAGGSRRPSVRHVSRALYCSTARHRKNTTSTQMSSVMSRRLRPSSSVAPAGS